MTRNKFKLHDLSWVNRLKIILLTLTISIITPLPASQNIAEAIPAPKKSPERWIQVDLSQQKLTAWEGKRRVYTVKISSGKKSTPTPVGRFRIQSKHRTTRMRGRGYDLANVPYTLYYHGSYAIHGAYWHKRFGTPVSHGCINLPPNRARLIFNWASVGTPVVVKQ
ncbi:L,D-transpeptidase [Raphidiopsis sp. BLCC-F218]